MAECIFCKIAEKKVPSAIVYEDSSVMVFRSIKPLAPIHLLIIPKRHISSVNEIKEEDKDVILEMFLAAQKTAEKMGVKRSGYKLAVNVEKGGGQEVFHLHMHFLSGWEGEKDIDVPGMP